MLSMLLVVVSSKKPEDVETKYSVGKQEVNQWHLKGKAPRVATFLQCTPCAGFTTPTENHALYTWLTPRSFKHLQQFCHLCFLLQILSLRPSSENPDGIIGGYFCSLRKAPTVTEDNIKVFSQ